VAQRHERFASVFGVAAGRPYILFLLTFVKWAELLFNLPIGAFYALFSRKFRV
jgi:hypothetical protein